jgi:putative nucleotidyltransferase with HDIG domain
MDFEYIYNAVKSIVGPVYLVGGSVRDMIMKKEPKDYDFCTPLSPDEIEQAIKTAGKRAYNIGKRFGTVGMTIEGQMIEITTFRTEQYTPGSRKPQVQFVQDITADLSRRDFRINAIAYIDGKYIDPFGGKLDILERSIKCVGEPKARFKEDPLRMLRAARFAYQLEFSLDNFLENTTGKMSHKILEVSRERWVMEMDKLLMTAHPETGLDFLARTHLLHFMFPELSLQVDYDQNSPFHSLDLWEHTKHVVLYSQQDINIRWAALLHDVGKPFVRGEKPDRSNYIKHDLLGAEIVDKYASYLKWSNERREKVKDLVLNHLLTSSPLYEPDKKAH